MTSTAQHGHIYRILLEPDISLLGLVISMDTANAVEDTCNVVLVSRDRNVPTGLPRWVRMVSGDPTAGHIVCHDINTVTQVYLKEDLGPITLETQLRVNQVIKRTLGV
jgi:mRNA-degrading endonuclease toxin of MazEF toxin-antitoxin module